MHDSPQPRHGGLYSSPCVAAYWRSRASICLTRSGMRCLASLHGKESSTVGDHRPLEP